MVWHRWSRSSATVHRWAARSRKGRRRLVAGHRPSRRHLAVCARPRRCVRRWPGCRGGSGASPTAAAWLELCRTGGLRCGPPQRTS
ncbi:hypothetical protein HBB16_05010 [Pseudonocardia sp. MCCB 268]|nr:hypothetical protein [Pseudonocardia cytotoxica]